MEYDLYHAIINEYTISRGCVDALEKQIAKAAKKYARVIEYIAPVCLKKNCDDKEQLKEYIIDTVSKELADDIPDCVSEVAKVFSEYLNVELEAIKGQLFEIVEGERYINGNGDCFELGFVIDANWAEYPYIMKEFLDNGEKITDNQTFTKHGKFCDDNDPDLQDWNLVGIYWEGNNEN